MSWRGSSGMDVARFNWGSRKDRARRALVKAKSCPSLSLCHVMLHTRSTAAFSPPYIRERPPPEPPPPTSRRSNDAGGHPQVDAIHHAVMPSQSSPLDDASFVIDCDVST